MRPKIRIILAVVAGAALAACGGDDAPETTGRPMASQAPVVEDGTGANHPPEIERLSLRPRNPRPGERIVASVEASDPDGDPVRFSYQWTMNGDRVGDGASLGTEGFPKGSTVELRVVPSDGKAEGAGRSATARMDNQAPVMLGVVMEPLGDVTVLNDVVASPRASDPDGDELEYRYTWWINGDRVDNQGEILPKSEFKRGDRIEVAVSAYDGTTDSETLRSQPFDVGNAAPQITSSPGGFDEDGTFRYQLAAEDPDGDRRLRYRMLEGPDGMKMDLLSGLLAWTPTEAQAGNHKVVVEVDDMSGGKTTQSFEVRVAFEPVSTPANQE